MDRKIISTGAIFGMIAIILGAFGAHALKKVLSINELTTFETGVKYQMYHALFLLFIGMTNEVSQKTEKSINNEKNNFQTDSVRNSLILTALDEINNVVDNQISLPKALE